MPLGSEVTAEGGHQEQLPTVGSVEAEGAAMMTHRLPTNIARRPKPRQLHREPPGQPLPRRRAVGDRAFGQERWEVLQQATWRATEGKVSSQEINRHGISMGSMVVGTGKRVQVSPELQLEERDRVKVRTRVLAMAPVDMKVLALEERVGGNQILGWV